MDCNDYIINIHFIDNESIKYILESSLDNDAKYNLVEKILNKEIDKDAIKATVEEVMGKL